MFYVGCWETCLFIAWFSPSFIVKCRIWKSDDKLHLYCETQVQVGIVAYKSTPPAKIRTLALLIRLCRHPPDSNLQKGVMNFWWRLKTLMCVACKKSCFCVIFSSVVDHDFEEKWGDPMQILDEVGILTWSFTISLNEGSLQWFDFRSVRSTFSEKLIGDVITSGARGAERSFYLNNGQNWVAQCSVFFYIKTYR